MRVYKLASLILLAGTWSVACNDDGGTSGDGDGDGDVGAGPGVGDGDTTTPGDGDGDTTTPGDGDGDGDGALPSGCDAVVVAGTDGLLDDFNHSDDPNLPEGSAAPVGSWAHGHWLNAAGADPAIVREGGMGGGPGYLEASCDDEADANGDFPWCNTDFDMANPWQQWASIDLAVAMYDETAINCLDASSYEGISFKAKSAADGNSIRVQINTPDANADSGETYQSMELPLTQEWQDFQIPFSGIAQPGWSTVTAPLEPAALRAISFVVRTRVDQTDEGGEVIGETLAPYNVQLDDVSFY